MKKILCQLMLFVGCAAAPLVAQETDLPEKEMPEAVEEDEELSDAEKTLRESIRRRGEELVSLLRQVQDTASAGMHAARIRELLLWEPDAALLEQVDEEMLAVEFLESFELIAAELSRLAEQKFYGEETLQELLPYFEAEPVEETP